MEMHKLLNLNILKYILIIVSIFVLCTGATTVLADPSSGYSVAGSSSSQVDTSELKENNSCEFLLGDVNDKESFAYFLQEILNLMKITGPILVIILTIIDLVKTVASQDKDGLSKVVGKTFKRLIFSLFLFLIPALLNFLFLQINVYGVCNLK